MAEDIERVIESQIRGLDIGLEKDCQEYPCSFTLHLLNPFH